MTEGQTALKLRLPFGQGEVRCLTGLRGCAALMVMLYHFVLNMPSGSVPLGKFFYNGYLWVDLFFILSGFVMAYTQVDIFAGGYRLRAHLAFLASRIARIYPLYVIVIVESACLMLWRSNNLDPWSFTRVLALNLTLVQAWGLAPSLEGAAWSISTEWAAYLAFPLLLTATLLSTRRTAWLAGALALFSVGLLAVSPGPFAFPAQNRTGPLDIYSSATAAPIVRCVAEFTLGLLAFRIARHVATGPCGWAGPVSVTASVAILVSVSLHGLDVGVIVLFVVLLVSLSLQVGHVDRFLAGRGAYALGQWSYSIYLIHDKFSHPAAILRDHLESYVPFASEVAVVTMSCLVIVAAAVIFYCIERPLRRVVLSFARKWPMLRSEMPSRGQAYPSHAPQNLNALS